MIKQTTDIDSTVYQDALTLRKRVFIDEQGVPVTLEVDDDETRAIHFVLYDSDDKPVATLRLLPLAPDTLKLQRMAVDISVRKHGYGRRLVQHAEDYARTHGYHTITLSAQLTATGFYRSLGYRAQGEVFLDAGIRHITMLKEL